MSKDRVVVFGTGLFAEVADFYFTHDSNYEVVAFTATQPAIDKLGQSTLLEKPILPFEKITDFCSPKTHSMFIAVGYSKRNTIREKFYYQAGDKGYYLISYVSSKATIWPGFSCGANCFILEDNTIQPYVHIGNNTILWSGNHIGHHADVGNHCFISSHVVVSGSCTIDNNCFIGVNATLRDGITIGRHTIIGAGALIMKDTEPYGLYIGEGTKADYRSSNEINF